MNNQPKHTPGPWHWYVDRNAMISFLERDDSPAVRETVSAIMTPIRKDMSEQIAADLNLIAAAPELLEAAKAYLAVTAHITQIPLWQSEKLQQAINKAEGQS